jgi:hypothetical protein
MAPGSVGSAARVSRIHQAPKSADVLAMAPPALVLQPPTPHRNDHDHSPEPESRNDVPALRCAGYGPAVMERWLNHGKLMKTAEKSGHFRALPWRAQSGIVRAVFPGGDLPPVQALP